MLPGEEEFAKKKKKANRPQWIHVKTITEDVLWKAVKEENDRRDSQREEGQNGLLDKVLANSVLHKLFNGMKGVTVSVDFEPSSCQNVDVSVEAKVDNAGVSGGLTENLTLSPALKKMIPKLTNIPTYPFAMKTAAQTIAAYIIVDIEKGDNPDLLALIGKYVTEWVNNQ